LEASAEDAAADGTRLFAQICGCVGRGVQKVITAVDEL
jgi:hypothetical protein